MPKLEGSTCECKTLGCECGSDQVSVVRTVQCVIVFTYVSVIMSECMSVHTPKLVIVFLSGIVLEGVSGENVCECDNVGGRVCQCRPVQVCFCLAEV